MDDTFEPDWTSWQAKDLATLVFVVQHGQVLLIRKKRGLGAGKVNGPGGRREAGEAALACAIRECEEEVLVTPTGLERSGRLRFHFLDGYGIDVTVFRASGCVGEPGETDEALPFWAPVANLPYEEMWEDDQHWLPHLLATRPFDGRFVFDGERMLSCRIDLEQA
jgi:8-oxo-dGTP diphosphatase